MVSLFVRLNRMEKLLSVAYPAVKQRTASSLAYMCNPTLVVDGAARSLGFAVVAVESFAVASSFPFALALLLLAGLVEVTFTSTAVSLSLMKASQAFCNSSCSVVSEGSGRSFRAGDAKAGILGSLDKGSTLE